MTEMWRHVTEGFESWIESLKVSRIEFGKGEQRKNADGNDVAHISGVMPCEADYWCVDNAHGIGGIGEGANELYVVDVRFTSGQDSM